VSETTGDVLWVGDDEALRFPPRGDPYERSGWAAHFSNAVREADAQVFIRFGLAGNVGFDSVPNEMKMPLVVHETVVRVGANGGTATGSLVRDVPFARLEAAANLRLSRLPARPTDGDYPFVNLDGRTQAPPPVMNATWYQPPERGRRPRRPSLRLRIPAGHKKPDHFYERVAELYLWLSTQAGRPANELADANNVPVTTVHGWVKEARRRGFLLPGQRGKNV
jgi:hypothetical protein